MKADGERNQEAIRDLLLGFHSTLPGPARQIGMESIHHLVTINKHFKNSTMSVMSQEDSEAMKRRRVLRLGDTAQIVSGPFQAFTGRIEGINQAKALLKVKVEIFGRETAIKLSFSEVKNLRWQ
jgi:transcription antitermination factor NusG